MKTSASWTAVLAAGVGLAGGDVRPQSAPGYEPGPEHYRVPKSFTQEFFEPPHDIRVEWIGDSFVGMVPSINARLPGAFANTMDFRASPAGGFAAYGMIPRWNPARNKSPSSNHVISSTPLRTFAYSLTTPSQGWEYAPGFALSLPIDTSWTAQVGQYWSDQGPQGEFFRMRFHQQRAFGFGLNRLYDADDELAFRGLLMTPPTELLDQNPGLVPDEVLFMIDAGGLAPETPTLLWGGVDPSVFRGRAFSYTREMFRPSWAEGASLLEEGAVAPASGRLNGIYFSSPGGLSGDAPVVHRNDAGDPELSLRLGRDGVAGSPWLSWTGGVLYRNDAQGEALRGPFFNTPIGINSMSYQDVDGLTPDTRGSKNFKVEDLRDWYWQTTLRADREMVVFIHFAAESEGRAQTEDEIFRLLQAVYEAAKPAEREAPVSVVFVVPFLHTIAGAELADSVAQMNLTRDAAIRAVDRARVVGVPAGMISLYDRFDGVFFDGSPDAVSYLEENGYRSFDWGASTGVDAVAETGGVLLDGFNLHISAGSPYAGGIFASGFRDVLADVYLRSVCVGDVQTTGALPAASMYGVPDGVVNGADLSYFVEAWLDCNLAVSDLTTLGANPDDPAYGIADGSVDGPDLFFFVELWLQGCP